MSRSHAVLTRAVLGLVAVCSGCAQFAGPTEPQEALIRQVIDGQQAEYQANRLLSKLDALDPQPLETLTPTQMRQQPTLNDAARRLGQHFWQSADEPLAVPGIASRSVTVPGAVADLPATLYTPPGSEPLPLILYFHGGGWVIGDRHTYDASARRLAHEAQALVLSVDYRLAPEHPFPAAHDDALAVYRWLTQHAGTLGADPQRLALAGEDAGGNLALATAIAARQARLPAPCHVLAISPITQVDTEGGSYQASADARPVNRATLRAFFRYLSSDPATLSDPRISLLKADLRGLPPVTLITPANDPLLDDSARLDQALRAAGVPLLGQSYWRMPHDFFGAWAVLDKAKAAQVQAGQRLRADLQAARGR